MEIKLSIKQTDIEQAIRDYVASKGITTPVRAINFATSRKNGFSISAEVEVSETAPEETGTEETETPDAKPEVKAEAPAAKATPKPRAKPKAVETTKAEVAEPEVAGDDTGTPWEEETKTEAANDAETPAPAAKSKSLFG